MFKKLPDSQNGISNRAGLMLMTGVLLLAFALGSNGLNRDIIWTDELYSISNMGGFDPPYSPAQIIDSLVTYSPDQVPLYYLLGAGWASVTGWSQVSLRYFALLAGILMIAWLYRFAADAVNRRTAVVAALLMSTSAFIILYFHEIRMYTMLMCLGTAHSWLYWRLAHNFRTTRLTWLLFTLTATMLLYTHNFAIILFVGLGAYHLLFVSKSRRWLNITLAWGLGAALFLPYVPLVISGLSYVSNNKEMASLLVIADALAGLLVNNFDLLWPALILSFGYALYRKPNHTIVQLLIVTAIMCLSLLLLNEHFKIIKTTRIRYFLILWFLFVILFAYSLTSMPRWRLVTALFVLLWGIAGVQLERSVNIFDYAGIRTDVRVYPPLHDYADNLNNKTIERDYLIGFSETWFVNWDRKHGWSPVDYYVNTLLGIEGVFVSLEIRDWELRRDIRKLLNERPYVLLAYNPENQSQFVDKTLEIIQGNYMPCAILVDKPDLLAQRYVHSVMGCDHEPAPIEYNNSIKVIDRAARYVPESDLVQILTWWEVEDESLLDEYNVSMQIITPDWQNMRQEDRHLYELPPWDVVELSTKGLPPGDYRLVIILYHRDTGEKVSGADPTTGEAAKIWPILEFTIESDS